MSDETPRIPRVEAQPKIEFTSIRLKPESSAEKLSPAGQRAATCLKGLDVYKVFADKYSQSRHQINPDHPLDLAKAEVLNNEMRDLSLIRTLVMTVDGFKDALSQAEAVGEVDVRASSLCPPSLKDNPAWSELFSSFKLAASGKFRKDEVNYWSDLAVRLASMHVNLIAEKYLGKDGGQFPGETQELAPTDSQSEKIIRLVSADLHNIGNECIAPIRSSLTHAVSNPETSEYLLPKISKIFKDALPELTNSLGWADASTIAIVRRADRLKEPIQTIIRAEDFKSMLDHIKEWKDTIPKNNPQFTLDLNSSIDPNTAGVEVLGDTKALAGVLHNFIYNAERFRDTQIDIQVQVVFDSVTRKPVCVMAIKTNGEPFNRSIIAAGRFVRGQSREADGSIRADQAGIGLASAQEAVEASGGRMILVNSLDKEQGKQHAGVLVSFPLAEQLEPMPQTASVREEVHA